MSEQTQQADRRIAALLDLGRCHDALPLIGAELAGRPDDPDLHGWHAQARLGLRDWAGALESANRRVAVSPEHDWGHRLASIALDGLGQHAEAVRAAREAVRIAPHRWQNQMRLASALADVPGGLDEALRAAHETVRLAPNEADAHFIVGFVSQRRGDKEIAREAYQRTLALDPEHAMTLNNLTVLKGRRSLTEAVRGYAAGLRVAPDDAVLRQNLDALIRTFPTRLYRGALLALIVAIITVAVGGPLTWASIGLAAGFVAGVVGYVFVTLHSLPGNVRGYFVRSLYRTKTALWNWLVFGVAALFTLLTCLTSAGLEIGLLALRPILVGSIIGTIIYRARRRG